MNEKSSPQDQIKNFTKKLDSPQITLLQTKNLINVELKKLLDEINAEYGKQKNPPPAEEIKKIDELIKEFNRKAHRKVLGFADK